MAKKIVLVPYDPVHDVGLKMIRRALDEKGHETILLPPDLSTEEIISNIKEQQADVVLLSRTLGYGVGELLARFIDMADAAGLRERTKMAIGGMAIRRELAAELGFDAGFGPGTTIPEVVAFVEGVECQPEAHHIKKTKQDMTQSYSYRIHDAEISRLLDDIVAQYLSEVAQATTPATRRAKVRDQLWSIGTDESRFIAEYVKWCDDLPRNAYLQGVLHPKTRKVTLREQEQIKHYAAKLNHKLSPVRVQHTTNRPLIFVQYGTGCPLMDTAHIKEVESWGADGVIHFDPSWGARTEGLIPGCLTHQEDGTVLSPENLKLIKDNLFASTFWQVRAHRGLNTPETVVIAGKLGADLTKINIAYGALAAGTDPERLAVDGYHAITYAKKYNMPFDVVTNEELAGVPAFKAFASMLITVAIGIKLGARPILQPLFCYSPEMMITNHMDNNYIDYNYAKIQTLKKIIDAPIWPGAPIGFLTHTEERVQSSGTTALHAALALTLGVDAISIASSDEAYSGGPIVAQSRVDTLRATGEAFRFFGDAQITPTANAASYSDKLYSNIVKVLKQVLPAEGFIQAMYKGVLGSAEDGAYPGRAGRGTVTK